MLVGRMEFFVPAQLPRQRLAASMNTSTKSLYEHTNTCSTGWANDRTALPGIGARYHRANP